MALTIDDIRPGCVAFLDTEILLRDSRLQWRGGEGFPSRPFLCAALRPGQTVWYPLTSKPGACGKRFLLLPEWIGGGHTRWCSGPNYVKDLREPYIGRDVVFLEASAREWLHPGTERPYVTQAGIDAIFAEMAARNYLTP